MVRGSRGVVMGDPEGWSEGSGGVVRGSRGVVMGDPEG